MPNTYIYHGFENGQTHNFELYVDEDNNIVLYSNTPVQGMAFTKEQAMHLRDLINEKLEELEE